MPRNNLLPAKIGCACCSAGSTITSLGCMVIMSATIAASGAVALGSMGAMGSMAASNSFSRFPAALLNSIGLGFLAKVNLRTLEIILVILLLIGIINMYLSYRFHKNLYPLILSITSSILIYVSIFIVTSNVLYYVSLIGLIVAPIWNFYVKTNKV